jgi:hypothetical protein
MQCLGSATEMPVTSSKLYAIFCIRTPSALIGMNWLKSFIVCRTARNNPFGNGERILEEEARIATASGQ